MYRCIYVLLILQMFITSSLSLADTFPYRYFYPEVSVIELADLKAGFDKGKFIIIDVRSAAEFNAIHIKGAVNLPYTHRKFTNNLWQLAKNNPNKKIAVYCNGITSIKSYKAAEDALYERINNIYAFDAGIKAWAEEYPALTLMNGQAMVSTEMLRSTDIKYIKATLDYENFKDKSTAKDAVVIDIRDHMQKKQPLPELKPALHIPLDEFVNDIILKEQMKDKDLYIFDQVGKQANWLIFYLEGNGYTNYHFLDGGATAVLKVQEYR